MKRQSEQVHEKKSQKVEKNLPAARKMAIRLKLILFN